MSAYALAAPPPASRFVPVVTPAGLTRAPLMIVFGYVVATFLLFLLWPINWPIYDGADWLRLIAYVGACLVAIAWATMAGSAGPARVTAPLPWLNILLPAAALAAVLLLVPSSFAYTGKGPWDMMEALQDQGGAYHRLQLQLLTTTGQRTTIAVLRASVAPFIYAALPLGIIHWRRIGWIGRVSVLIAVMTSIIFSIMRGTDKEIADLFVIGTAAAFVSFGRACVMGEASAQMAKRYWAPALIGFVFLYFAQGLFTERKDERLGGYASRTAVCANDSRICADLDNPAIAWLPLRQRFGLTVFILSTCSGYYGLELAMEKPFEPGWGVGHSPAALSVYETVTGDREPHLNTYTYRNGADHWSEDNYWSTLIAWIANDVGFVGAIPVLALIGFVWGRWWREAAAGMSDPSAVLFALATTMIFYLPANNQVLASYDGYTIFATWIVIWLWHRSRRALSVSVPTGLGSPP
ncbi:hypothetical protein [Sphingomonas sp.]|jgi:hypothetical protein|uniref:hypothetical protein n=1 Tax=Sphingomonas sp. TaxID=28214 RepID=UPI002E33F6A2|nr:hypothetical protein [Sphingomonas sp.]HEX4695445.1 hypothetical protein [Sphingomonas sp.]